MQQQQYERVRWGLLAAGLIIPAIAWLQNLGWSVSGISVYQIFPLLGLWAYFVMAGHFLVGAIRVWQPQLQPNAFYSKATGHFVLAMLLMHPGLFVWQLWADGYGKPPASYEAFLGAAAYPFVLLGTIALLTFLAFEVLERLATRPAIHKQWFWVLASQAVALSLIFVHALRLGGVLDIVWFQILFVLLYINLLVSWWVILRAEWHKRTHG